MSYRIIDTKFDNYIKIKINGIWPAEDSEKIISELNTIIEEHNSNYVFIDLLDLQDNPSVTRDYMEAEVFFENKFYRYSRIAVLDQIKRKKNNDFFELTTKNRGMNFHFVYNDEQEAIDWLLG